MKKPKNPYSYGKNVYHMYPNVTVTLEEITPEIAKEMLGVNLHNRGKKRALGAYAKDMASGNWEVNGATLVFSDEGVLLDGQNRLYACIEADTPFHTFVVRGVTEAAQESMDIGATRTLADMLSLRGYPNAIALAAITSSLARVDRHNSLESGFYKVASDTFSRRELLTYVEEHYTSMHMADIVRYTRPVSNKKEPTGMWGVLIREFLKSGEDDTMEFIRQVSEAKKPSDQVFELLKKLKDNRESTKSEQQRIIAAWIIKAWNAWMKGEPTSTKKLSVKFGGSRPEAFPQVYVAEPVDEPIKEPIEEPTEEGALLSE